MEIQGIKFTGPIKLDYSQIPEGKGVYIIDSPLNAEFAPQYIGYSVNLKRRIRNLLVHSPFPISILESKETSLYYAILNDLSSEEIQEIEKQLITEYQPALNKVSYKQARTETLSKDTKSKRERAKWISNLIAGITASLAAGIVLSMLLNIIIDFGDFPPDKTSESINALKENYAHNILLIDSLKNELHSVSVRFKSIADTSGFIKTPREFKNLQSQTTRLDIRLKNLEEAITFDAQKALSIPLIKKDLENLEKNFSSELGLSRASVDRIYDQNKWFMGLMFTIALSVLGMVINNFTRK